MTFLLLIAAILANGVVGEELRITSVDEFIEFKSNVRSMTNYSGTTVFLDSDLDFTGRPLNLLGFLTPTISMGFLMDKDM